MKWEKKCKQDRFATTHHVASIIKCIQQQCLRNRRKKMYWSFWETELFCFEVFKASKVSQFSYYYFLFCFVSGEKLKIWKLIRKTPISVLKRNLPPNIFLLPFNHFENSLFPFSFLSLVSFFVFSVWNTFFNPSTLQCCCRLALEHSFLFTQISTIENRNVGP